MSMQMTPNPLIKNSYASPVKGDTTVKAVDTTPVEKDRSLMIYNEPRSVRGFATLSSAKKQRVRGA